MQKYFYSHGKLLLTAEYLVLDGVTALALPTQKGQSLLVTENETNAILWRSFDDQDNCWFTTHLIPSGNTFIQAIKNPEPDIITTTLINILTAAKALNPNFLSIEKGYYIESKLEFNRQWGLGSSSTLINNIAQWAKVDAFTLLENSFGGSGYDIACAQRDTPILYQRNQNIPKITVADFNPIFKNHLFFIYLNQKQDSKASIKHYQSLSLKDFDKAATIISEITSALVHCSSLNEFQKLIDLHENTISNIIKTPTIKSILFPEYSGSIKSLGGWGGDFVLATGSISDIDYFTSKGYSISIPYKEMILE
ncbi:GYDIA family GHMP kinase [Aquimarina longa]|uniref:GYDIA family GHMP kinase n=1 Tax=Aquimarina longa TaxID=1080221 RepID=UPI0007844FC5|nr:GYDIA family GHMP kinase [Aquimarina longa]